MLALDVSLAISMVKNLSSCFILKDFSAEKWLASSLRNILASKLYDICLYAILNSDLNTSRSQNGVKQEQLSRLYSLADCSLDSQHYLMVSRNIL